MTSLLTRRDWTVLTLSALDIFSEAQSAQILVLFLSTNLGTDNQLGHWSLALIRFVQGLFIFLFGNYLRVWPGDGPLRALVYGNALQVVFLAVLVAAALLGVGLVGYGVVLCLALILYAGGEAMGSVAFSLTYMKLCSDAPPQKQTAMMSWDYALMNMAIAAGGSGIPLLWRWVFAAEQLPVWFSQYGPTGVAWAESMANSGSAGANVACLVSGMVSWIASSTLLFVYHRRLAREMPDVYPPAKADVEEFFKPKPCVDLWAQHKEQLRAPGMGLFVLVTAGVMFGILNAFVDLGLVLPKYLIWRHGQVTWFPLFTAINPLLITILAPLVLLLINNPAYQLIQITLGTLLQATAPFWAVYLQPPLVGIVVFLVQFTIGEAISMPQFRDYRLRLIGDPRFLPYATAIVQLPLLVAGATQTALSGFLLDRYCAGPGDCPAGRAELVWLVVAAIALTTPIGFLLVGAATHRREDEDDGEDYTPLTEEAK